MPEPNSECNHDARPSIPAEVAARLDSLEHGDLTERPLTTAEIRLIASELLQCINQTATPCE